MKKKKEIKFPNLRAEMLKHGETQQDLANILKQGRVTINKKITGKRQWLIGDIEDICKHYSKDYYELFKQSKKRELKKVLYTNRTYKKKFDISITQIEGERNMKLKKGVQRVLEVLCTIAVMLLLTTIESEWSLEYLVFVMTNLAIASATGLTLKKFGRWE